MTVDYFRWMSHTHDLPPLVVDEFRMILLGAIDEMDCEFKGLLNGLRRSDFEPFLARKLGLLSLEPHDAPAAVISMWYFYDFLGEQQLVSEQDRHASHVICQTLWKDVKGALRNSWREYQFLEQYLPEGLDK